VPIGPKAYDAVFKTIKRTVKFNVAEVLRCANWVLGDHFSRKGQSPHYCEAARRPTGAIRVPEDRRHLEDRRYCFCTPPTTRITKCSCADHL